MRTRSSPLRSSKLRVLGFAWVALLLSAFAVHAAEAAQTPPAADAGCHVDAPSVLTDYIEGHGQSMTRIDCDADVALYFDDGLQAAPAAETAWIGPLITDVWQYFKRSYGDCAVPRELPAPIGPGCEKFGAPKPLVAFLHRDAVRGGTIQQRFDAGSGYRNTIDVGSASWSPNNDSLRDRIVHEACHQVEGAGQGVHDSPAFSIWGDSKWAEFCVFDFYWHAGRAEDAYRVFNQWMNGKDDLPAGGKSAAWFRDWFVPIWQASGKSPAVMDRFFGLLSRHFPTSAENNGRNLVYGRRMNAGEFVHFLSGAVGEDVSGRAAFAFNSGFSRSQFDQAKRDFPQVTYAPAACVAQGVPCAPIRVTYPGPAIFATRGAKALPITTEQPPAGTLRYSAEGLPDGVSIDASTGLISGVVITPGRGLATVTATAGDASGVTSFVWTAAERAGALRDGTGQCVDNWDGRTADDNQIMSQKCTGIPQQTAAITGTQVGFAGKCMSLHNGEVAVGAKVVLWRCNGSDAQKWQIDQAAGTVRNGASGTCLTANGFERDLTVTPCAGTPGQQWQLPGQDVTVIHPGAQSIGTGQASTLRIRAEPAIAGTELTYQATGLPPGLTIDSATGVVSGRTTAAAASYTSVITARTPTGTPTGVTVVWTVVDFVGAVRDGNGFCLDNWDGRTADGNRIMSQECTGIPQQNVAVSGDRMTLAGKCLSLSGRAITDGTKVVLWTCDGGDVQRWRFDPVAETLRNAASGTCLTGNGFQSDLTIAPCVGTTAQKWQRITP
ncbi:ricin-type beta-trefoil lectin domain protein [Actinoplanes sp. NPDC049265]|uniref:ricin-type beta-trefoil lectin domain protein n=1 Tax=Actinoplanes sp. NPDC049265 TaxID=3363902 RepID=UPI00371DFAA6